ncbi:SIR2 family NAD-dependent protein deacylase [Zongyangia hominis]|uniref:Sir2 silent information regulator family NAD-dependent deacetylase n=1 Tax=Zongyangia hominis TaxID=2763677 RepID=A0A926EAS1_9FIRM|nr:Sir2 silent information regulator family NAD-dependent deacetylase [Zongyangia hominis]MBC8571085.1 Sir2 silent information regulator family NAD-dependent deacetylase [Zongyangia hominis]
MFSRILTRPSTAAFSVQIDRLREELRSADAIVVGAGAGLSISAGLVYTGKRFHQYFGDFEEKYGFHDMYSGGFYRYGTWEEYWAYWSRYIYINRYLDPPKPVYQDLAALLKGKDYFVLTTNVDHCFQKAGIEKERLFYTQGDYGLFQCSEPCHQKTYDNEETIRAMVARQENMRAPSDLLPRCPVCGKPMAMNLRCDHRFVEDEGWHRAKERYVDFLRRHQDGRVLFLELGVGYNTPVIIKYPFWEMANRNPQAVYACVNNGEAQCPEELAGRSLCIEEDIGKVLQKLKNPEKTQRTGTK